MNDDGAPINRVAARRSSAAGVVLVHGLFLGAWVMRPLAARLRAAGYQPTCFGYRTVTGDLADNVAGLAACVTAQAAAVGGGRVHVVAHSLGGLLLRHTLAARPGLPVGTCVMLGTPNRGSHVARRLAAWPGLGRLLATGLRHGLDGSAPGWPAGRPVHVVAGTRGFGAGRIVPGLARPNDGTVSVEETRLDGAPPSIRLHHTHTGMLFAAEVADAVLACLDDATGGG